MNRIAIGISGEVAAGKTTAGKALQGLGFGYTRISMVIDEMLKESGDERSRERHQELGWRLHKERGQAWLCEQAIAIVDERQSALVLDGIRWKEDVAFMRKRYGSAFLHLHVTAPESQRRLRFELDDKGIPYADVIAHPVEQGVSALAMVADAVIANDKGRDAFLLGVFGSVLKKQIHAN